jgi:hypothetical protein
MKAPALHLGECVADELLDARERAAELLEVALDERHRETWLVSALHGIRVVTAWANGGPPAGGAPRAGGWQRLLDGLAARHGV